MEETPKQRIRREAFSDSGGMSYYHLAIKLEIIFEMLCFITKESKRLARWRDQWEELNPNPPPPGPPPGMPPPKKPSCQYFLEGDPRPRDKDGNLLKIPPH